MFKHTTSITERSVIHRNYKMPFILQPETQYEKQFNE